MKKTLALSLFISLTVCAAAAQNAPTGTPHQATVSFNASAPNGSVPIATYEVWRSPAPGPAFAKIATVSGTSYVDTAVVAGQSYLYCVLAKDANGNQSDCSPPKTGTVPTNPNAPGNVTVVTQ